MVKPLDRATSKDVVANGIDRLYSLGVNSENRAAMLVAVLQKLSGADFWAVFNAGWNSCDRTWKSKATILRLLREAGNGHAYLSGKDATFLAGLSTFTRIYRGCSSDAVRGLSWTTKADIAARFARGHRGISVADPVIASAYIRKDAIFTVCTDRKENEIVIDPRRLTSLNVNPFGRVPEVQHGSH